MECSAPIDKVGTGLGGVWLRRSNDEHMDDTWRRDLMGRKNELPAVQEGLIAEPTKYN